jgi:hypothetical protein
MRRVWRCCDTSEEVMNCCQKTVVRGAEEYKERSNEEEKLALTATKLDQSKPVQMQSMEMR